MEFKKGNIPLYFQFYLKLKQEIITGDRPPGTMIPTLEELSKTTGISHGMIRKALELLEAENLIKKKQRVGTIVQENRDRKLWTPSASRTELRERFLSEDVEYISSQWVNPPNRIMRFFNKKDEILKDGKIYHLQFLLISKEDSRRRNLSDLFVPSWRYNELDEKDLKAEPIKSIVKDQNITKIKQIIRPWFCDFYASKYIQMPEGSPILHRTLVSYHNGELAPAVLEQLTTVYALERDIEINP